MKVLHLPTDVGGFSWGLAAGEKKLGLDSTVLLKQGSWLEYPSDINLEWDKKGRVAKFASAAATLLKIRKEFDVYHFNFGASLIDPAIYPLFDLPFYPRNKKIFFTYNGCDARQKLKTMERVGFSACHEAGCYGGMCNDGALDLLRAKKIEKVSRRAAGIFALNPDLLWVLPEWAVFLPYTIAAWDRIDPTPYKIGKKLTIVHAPTNRGAKGSEYILKALEELKKTYKNIKVVLVENKVNEEALKIYAEADLVIDQALIGWYGGLAVEVMKMGRPVAAFIRDEDLKFIPEKMAHGLKDAIININPQNIAEVLKEYLDNTRLLERRHEAVLDYVHRWHDPLYVAGITKSFYEGECKKPQTF